MHGTELDERLEQVFQKTFGDDSLALRDEMTAQDFPDWDSVCHINLMLNIEQAFGMQFVGNELAELPNIGALKELLRARARV